MNIDIASRYVAAFGNSAITSVVPQIGDYNMGTYTADTTDFEDVTIKYDEKELKFAYKLLYAHSTAKKEDKSIFAPPLIIGFSREKNLIITPLNGDGMEVVERWNNQPWDISIQGILIDMEEHHYPTDKVEKLRRMFDYNNVLEVSGQLFYEKGIDFMYVKSISINGVEGFQDTVQFSIQARSITDIGFSIAE